MKQLPLSITRNRGYEITGPEKYRRLLIANILELEINAYEIFHLLEFDTTTNFFFNLSRQIVYYWRVKWYETNSDPAKERIK